MKISIIVAVAKNNVIGNNNQLIWRLSADLKRFKALTTGHHILMGRKTFESIGKALPNRTNIVITRSANFQHPETVVLDDIQKGIDFAKLNGETELFVIGGGEIYKNVLPLADKLYLTKVHTSPLGDTFFPELNEAEWQVIAEEAHLADDKNEFNFVFLDAERKA
jgi:dihydrofolate reductase